MTPPAGRDASQAPLTATELRRLLGWTARLPLRWTSSVRRRRWLVLALAAPGFLLVAATPMHRALALMALGLGWFAAALLFRHLTEPLFVRAEAAALWPPAAPFVQEDLHA